MRKTWLGFKQTTKQAGGEMGKNMKRSKHVPSVRIPPANLPCCWQLKSQLWLRRIWLGITSVSVCEWGEEIRKERRGKGREKGKEKRKGDKTVGGFFRLLSQLIDYCCVAPIRFWGQPFFSRYLLSDEVIFHNVGFTSAFTVSASALLQSEEQKQLSFMATAEKQQEGVN